ncbi:ArgS-related anticodon-binding protein NrtL [Streptomyces sp. Amel2xC10]|uniref:ArgS-related anticodon-binding protein NrtL n=1 Tax=Streptomyces sp. Amel2xC10 TaxID=1305826 RepID=UPI000A088EE6|nr:DALR anticodon-binding domain-containing protein [Streptomyces sp. Amel2xC10]SMF54694.1 arginyl-tRNA synthetase [Streptomyces sp. Amel2xC10]
MTPVELSRTVLGAVRRAVDAGELRVDVPERVVVAPPGPGGVGDFATNIALQLARPAGQPPLRVAELLRPHLVGVDGITGVEITGPGFLNIRLDQGVGTALVRRILDEGAARYGHSDTLASQVYVLRVPYEVRAEVVADVLARMVSSQGARVEIQHQKHQKHQKQQKHPKGDKHETVDVRPVPVPEDPAPLGPDAARWALLHPAPSDRPRITADHLVQREGNPLFRVRYAHARTRAVVRNAADLGFTPEPGTPEPGTPLLPLLTDYPRILATAAPLPRLSRLPRPDGIAAPSRLARHLVAVADAVLDLLPATLPRGDEKPSAAHRARLALAEAAGTVLAGGLSLLGIDAPDHL